MITEDDILHVCLDALDSLRNDIGLGYAPWVTYAGSEDDPKLTRDGYMSIIQEAKKVLSARLSLPPDQRGGRL